MVKASFKTQSRRPTIRLTLGTGWETSLDDVYREMERQFKVCYLRLPLKRRIPYSKVVHLAAVCEESWWSRALMPAPVSGSFGRGAVSMACRPERTEMPSRAWRYHILMTLKGGKTIKICNVK